MLALRSTHDADMSICQSSLCARSISHVTNEQAVFNRKSNSCKTKIYNQWSYHWTKL